MEWSSFTGRGEEATKWEGWGQLKGAGKNPAMLHGGGGGGTQSFEVILTWGASAILKRGVQNVSTL